MKFKVGIQEEGGKFIVYNEQTGNKLGEHDTWNEAREQQKAIYANMEKSLEPEIIDVELKSRGRLMMKGASTELGAGKEKTEQSKLIVRAKEKPVENLDDKLKEDKKFKLQGRISFRGLDIAIENKKGSVRKGVDDDGEEWRTKMFYPYGYIQKTQGTDGDKVDCFLGPNKESDKVFIIHQNNPETGKYDEDKVMLGFEDWNNARDAYLAHYDDQEFLGDHTEMDFDTFKEKVLKTEKKPGMIKSLWSWGKRLSKSQFNLFGEESHPQMSLFHPSTSSGIDQKHAGDTLPGKHGTLIIKKNPSGHGAHVEYLAKDEEKKTSNVKSETEDVKESYEMPQNNFVKPKITITAKRDSDIKPPEGVSSFYGRATLGSKFSHYIIEDTPANRDWIRTNKYTIAREQPKSNTIEYQKEMHKYFVEQALEEGKQVPEEVLKDYPDLKSKYQQKENGKDESTKDEGRSTKKVELGSTSEMENKLAAGFDSILEVPLAEDALKMTMEEFKKENGFYFEGDTSRNYFKGNAEEFYKLVHEAEAEKKKEKPDQTESFADKIEDFGNKIGGARKDLAESSIKQKPKIVLGDKEESKQPAWMKGFHLGKKDDGKYQPFAATERGWITWRDRNTYDTPEEALMAIKMANVAQRFRITESRGGGYEVYRKVTDRKFHTIKTGFESREDAMRYLVENVDALLEYKPEFPERPHIEDLQRSGIEYRKGNISPEQFREAFDFSGGEFGNWVPQDERQRLLNMAYDGLMDLANVLQLDPKTLSLDGKLSIAFGARGQGLSKAAAHYERDRAVFNLTRIKGAGSVAHEWFHALDHYLGLLDRGRTLDKDTSGKIKDVQANPSSEFLSYGGSFRNKANQEFLDTYKKVIETISKQPKIVDVSIDRYEAQKERVTEEFEKAIKGLREYISKDRSYGKKKQAATSEQLAQFNKLIQKIEKGELGEDAKIETKERFFNSISTKQVYKELNDLITSITGRSEYKRDFGAVKGIEYAKSRLDHATKQFDYYSKLDKETKDTPTKYYYDARDIDKMRASDYWTVPHEMAARAFEAYVDDKIQENGNLSQYLVHSTQNHIYKLLYNLSPYPEDQERKNIDASFDDLFNVIKKINFKNLRKQEPVAKSLETQPLHQDKMEEGEEEIFEPDEMDEEMFEKLIPMMKEVYEEIL